jgi:hypothetical protein
MRAISNYGGYTVELDIRLYRIVGSMDLRERGRCIS